MDRIGVSTGERKRHSTEAFGSHDKVAIPRAASALQPPPRRTERACQECRERKIRCGGQRPACEQCATFGVGCVYPLSHQEKQKAQVEQLKSENEELKSVLVKLSGRVGSIADDIDQTLGVRPCFSLRAVPLYMFNC